MDPLLADILREIEDASRLHGGMPRIAREAGHFLNLQAKAKHAREILQVGVHDGYATLWLSEAAAMNDGRITCVEGDVWQFESAREAIERSPYTDHINLMQGELDEVLSVIEGPFDFVLLDCTPELTLHYLMLLMEKICSGSLIYTNNAMSHASLLTEYLSYVHETTGLESLLVPIGDGIEMTYKVP